MTCSLRLKPAPSFGALWLTLCVGLTAPACSSEQSVVPSIDASAVAIDTEASDALSDLQGSLADVPSLSDTPAPHGDTEMNEVDVIDSDTLSVSDDGVDEADATGPHDDVESEVSGPDLWEEASELFELGVLHEVALSLSEAQMTSLSETPDTWVHTQLTIDGEPLSEVGVRLHGQLGDFRDLDHGAGISLSFVQGTKGNEFYGLKALSLNNLSAEPSLVKELLSYALFRAVGVPAPRVAYATLSVNEQPYGVYLMVEPSESQAFLAHWFEGQGKGALYQGRDGDDLFVDTVSKFTPGAGTDPHSLSLYGLVQALDWIDPSLALSPQLDAIFGLQRYLDFIATELMIGHQDGYAWSQNGYNIYRASLSSPWGFMPVSADRTFSEHLAPLEGDGRVHTMCMADPECRAFLGQAYEAALARIVALDLVGMAQSAHALVADALLEDPRPAMAPDAVSAALEQVLTYLSERPTTLIDGLACLDPEYGDEDGDGFSSCFDADCHDGDPDVYPGAPEICNFADDDCDAEIDETAEDEENCPTCETVLEDDEGSVLLCRIAKNYADAHEACLSRGADLVSIHSMEAQQAIAEAAYADYSGHLWIGINDRIEEGTFAWTDGSPVDFEHWAGNEPNDWGSGEDCGHLYDGGEHRWNDLPCGHEAGYLCRVPDLSLP